ncbi:MAG: ATP-binding protein [Lentimicrobium sp.]
MISRQLEPIILRKLFKGKAILLIGPRQTGKTTMLRKIVNSLSEPFVWLDADEPMVSTMLSGVGVADLKRLAGNTRILVIDEAQQIPDIGRTLKLFTDHIKEVQLLVTGSSALELASGVNEPLTGRKFEYNLYPLSYMELVDNHGWLEESKQLEQRLIFGSYPEVVTDIENPKEKLTLLAGSYLYKDIFKYKDLRKPELLERLLQALAFQTGSEVSYVELGQIVGANPETIQRYVELLEKTFVVFRLRSFSRNLRNELKKSQKIYFYDNGIRNALINNYNPLKLRNDKGILWENYLLSERLKYAHYQGIYINKYFWRTHQQQEIDYIEERDGKLYAFEFKSNPFARAKIPLTFANSYPEHEFQLITPENFEGFLGAK